MAPNGCLRAGRFDSGTGYARSTKGVDMISYSDDSRYTITFEDGGYVHEVKMDGWITAEVTAGAISAKAEGGAMLTNNFNGAQARFKGGAKVWSDNGMHELHA